MSNALFEKSLKRGKLRVGIVGMGYVGLPLALAFCAKDILVLGVDIDDAKVFSLSSGASYLKHIAGQRVQTAVDSGLLEATSDFSQLSDVDAIILCVPTPLTKHREPDMSYVETTCEMIAPHLVAGQLVVLESTTYPGTTRDLIVPILTKSGLSVGTDLFVAYSPEREDPGNLDFETAQIPKVLGADDEQSLEMSQYLYEMIVPEVVTVSSSASAEAVKLTENIFRAVNIALVNELKVVFDRMGIDVWEVIEAAKSKPFGYMPFYPGPGLGGHCIPIDPFYLTWKAREFEINTRFIELAGEINTHMPHYVVEKLIHGMSNRLGKAVSGSNVLIVGMAYKKNLDDTRESPSLKVMRMVEQHGAKVSYFDPFIPALPKTREYPEFADRRSIEITDLESGKFDAAIICTDHDGVDYGRLAQAIPLIVDTRNVRFGETRPDNVLMA